MGLVYGFAALVILSILVGFLILWIRESMTANRLGEQLDAARAECDRLKAEIDRLSKWKHIADVADEAARIRASAVETLEQAEQDARILRSNADAEYEQRVASARDHESSAKRRASATLQASSVESARMVADAERRAREINERAFYSAEKVATNEAAARAMRNAVEGYGYEYLLPVSELLDELSLEYGHTHAGEQLRLARTNARALAKMGHATTCDYADQDRNQRAQSLVLDSFNGKVQEILSRAKHHNHGKLAAQIRDAYATVNYGGQAFRNARITDAYLDARLLELKWAASVQELKRRDREEQREIREQIREEQRAQREYEKARREAEQRQRMLEEAMEKARAQMGLVAEQERARFELELADLQRQLVEEQERNQRAISMAQQTRRGFVYIISNPGAFGECVYKIGLTRRLDPMERVRELGDASVPFPFDVHAILSSDDAPSLETSLHKEFVLDQVNKVNHRKEFFAVPLERIREAVARMGIDAKWTMRADAAEFRESLAIREKIESDPEAREQWLNRQLTLDPIEYEDEEAEALAT